MIYSDWSSYFRPRKKQGLLKNFLRTLHTSEVLAPPKLKKRRRYFGTPIYAESTWGRMLKDPRTMDPQSREGKLFRERFRVGYPKFMELVEFVDKSCIRVNAVTGVPISPSNATGIRCAPTDLLVLGALRVLGRGISFDGISELNGISEEVNRVFFHSFCERYAKDRFKSSCCLPAVGPDLDRVMASYADLGLPGCIGSTDCVHIHWDRCPAGERHEHVGKEGFPTRAFSVTCTHSRRIIACTGLNLYIFIQFLHNIHNSIIILSTVIESFPGATNDKTISRFYIFKSFIEICVSDMLHF
jgi:hypothetical protein